MDKSAASHMIIRNVLVLNMAWHPVCRFMILLRISFSDAGLLSPV